MLTFRNKKMKKISILIFIVASMLFSASCVVVTPHDNGKHKGWYKNPGNPHNNNSKKQGKSNNKSSTVIILTNK
jgi:hypothetical protein